MLNLKDEFKSKGVSVVLGSLNRITFLKLTIQSIREELKNAPFTHEIIVIDGGSTDGTSVAFKTKGYHHHYSA